MKHGRGGDQAPWDDQQYPPRGYGQQYPQDDSGRPGQYDPAANQRHLQGAPQQPWQQGYPQQGYGGQYPPQGQQPGYGQPLYPPQPPWQAAPPQAAPPRRKRHIMRNVLTGIGALVVAIVAIAVAANAGHHTIQTGGTTGNSNAGNGNTGNSNSGAGSASKTAVIGSAITLAGDGSGEQMTVTVTKVISDATGTDEFDQAPAGDRLYAVQFRLADTGSAAYSDSPSNGAAVVDSKGQSYESSFETVNDCVAYPASENIGAGASGLGCIVFEVPKSAIITQVQFTLDSGMGPQTGQWNVGGQS